MLGTILKIEKNAPFKGRWTASLYTIQPDPWKGTPKEPKEYAFFKGSEIQQFADANLAVGDRIDMTMEKKGNYWNPSAIKKIGTDIQDKSTPSYSTSSTSTGKSAETDTRIARAVALKAACDVLIANQVASKSKEPINVQTLILLAQDMEQYLNGTWEANFVPSAENTDETQPPF